MGGHDIDASATEAALRRFGLAVLDDIRTLERLCDAGAIESGVRRVGAEQEMFLVDERGRPAPLAVEVLERLDQSDFSTELGRFNLEYNAPATPLDGATLRDLERNLTGALSRVRDAAAPLGAEPLLAGILPSLELADLGRDNMTPRPRYAELNRVMTELTGGTFQAHISGLDELHATHDTVMLEACNASFQVHFQVSAGEFARLYNLAQVVTAPVLAAAANSPLLLQHRLWKETRIALFQQSLDVRSPSQKQRDSRQRVWFGDEWVQQSVIEIFRDHLARFPVLLTTDLGEPSSAVFDRGEVPALLALGLHNGTVYRWNRACYGLHEGRPHLRIENRALPAGPTVIDAVANAAFFVGLMAALSTEHEDVRQRFEFDHIKENFLAAARHGLNATFRWTDGRRVAAPALVLEELLPQAAHGLAQHGVPPEDIARYLGVLEQRVASGRTGAEWLLEGLERLSAVKGRAARFQLLTRTLMDRQRSGRPVHEWTPPAPANGGHWTERFRAVADVMTTDLFTVHPEDPAELAASIMYWKQVRHLPVEDGEGRLVGVVSYRSVLKLVADGSRAGKEPVPVRDIMRADPVTVAPDTSCLEAIRLMTHRGISSLPVLEKGRLVGIVTDRDFTRAAAALFERELGRPPTAPRDE